jgi:ankyrin repeat protein
VKTVKNLCKYVNDTCTTDDHFGNTPLTLAAENDHMAVVRVLLENGANAERANSYQSTALHKAASFGHLDMCRLLLDWGAKVDPVDQWKDTPLHWAAWLGNLPMVKLLVERGADVSLKNDKGQTASDKARSEGREDVAEWLDLVSRQ